MMTSVYKNAMARLEVRRWCLNRIADSGTAHVRDEVVTAAGVTSVVTVGPQPRPGEASVVLLPGTNMNAALCLPLAGALAGRRGVTILDLPGQPGLSAGRRPLLGRTAWYGQWLGEALLRAVPGPCVVVGHSLGGAVALACDSPQIAGRVLLSTAGIMRLRVSAPLLAATLPWLVRPSVPRAEKLLHRMAAPQQALPGHLGAWMNLVARCCRTSLAPPPLPSALLERRAATPTLAASGSYDPFLPPSLLGPAVQRRLGVELRVIEGTGHLLLDEAPAEVCAVIEELFTALHDS